MREIWPENNDYLNLNPENSEFATQVEFTKLVARFDELLKDFDNLQSSFINLKAELSESINTENLTVTIANISQLAATIADIRDLAVSNTITANEIKSLTSIVSDSLTTLEAKMDELEVTGKVTAGDLVATDTIIQNLKATTAEIENWTIENLQVTSAEIDTLSSQKADIGEITATSVNASEIEASTADIPEITNDNLTSNSLDSFEVKTSQLVWKETQDIVDADTFYIELPHYENGNYYIKAISDDDTTVFTIEATNSVDNYRFGWSQIEFGYVERAYVTSLTKQLVFRVSNLRKQKITLLYANTSSTNVGAPNIYEDYDKAVDVAYTLNYQNGNKFFRPLDTFRDGVDVGTLALHQSDYYNIISDDDVKYDTTENEEFTAYKPNQSVNTLDNVKFNSVEAPILDIKNSTIQRKIETPNIYNGPALDDLTTLNDDTLYIPNDKTIEYTGWAFKIQNVSEYTDNWQECCKGYDWSRTKYAGDDINFTLAQDVTQITDYTDYYIGLYQNKYYLVYYNINTGYGNACFLQIDSVTGDITYTDKLFNVDKQFWTTDAAIQQIALDKLSDYDIVYLGDFLQTYEIRFVYKNVELYKADKIPFIVSVTQESTLYRKTTVEDTENNKTILQSEIIPMNLVSKEDYIANTPITYNPQTRELTNDDDIVIKNDLTVKNDATIEGNLTVNGTTVLDNDLEVKGNLTVDKDTTLKQDVTINQSLVVNEDVQIDKNLTVIEDVSISGDTTVETLTANQDATFEQNIEVKDTATIKNLEVENIQVSEDVHIAGDLYVGNTIHANQTEDVVSAADTITLRANNANALANGQVSGIVINNYNGTDQLSLVTDNEGTLRVGTGDGTDTIYTNIAYNVAENKYYEFTDNPFTLGNEVTVTGTMTSWTNRRIENGYTLYDSITMTEIDKTSLVPLLGRDEDDNMTDKALLYYDKSSLTAKTIDATPTDGGQVLTTSKTEDNRIEYKWLKNSGGMTQAIFDAVHPIGDIYIQYPNKLDPNELYNQVSGVESTWTNISKQYKGAFFRSEGGNAQAFDNQTSNQGMMTQSHTHNITGVAYAVIGAIQGTTAAGNALNASTTGSYGGVETRPINYTIRIWERTA